MSRVPICTSIINAKSGTEFFNGTETKEIPEEPGEIVHLGHDEVLLLAAVMTFGADWNECRAEWVFLIILKWQEHLRGHPRFLISLGALEIDCCGGVESFRACVPNTRSGNRPDAFNKNELERGSGDCVRGRTSTTLARRWTTYAYAGTHQGQRRRLVT